MAGAAWLLAPAGLPAQEGASADGGSAPSVVAAAPRTAEVEIDGVLDELAWEQARPIGDFVQAEPVEGAPVDQPTEVRVLFDGGALYVAARMYDTDPASIRRQLVRRDERGQFDFFEVALDPNRDRRTGYAFRVSAANVQRDAYLFDDVREDGSWDAVWESAVRVDSLGWTAELRIPLSQLRFQPSDRPQEWGVNFARRRLASNETSYLALESRRRHGKVSVFAPLRGLVLPESVRRLEVRPYVLGRSRSAPAAPGDPFFDGREEVVDAGFDLRYGLGSAFTLDVTANPDFGQVEVDPAVINLSAYETFYPERRPFFVEDARIFDFSLSGGQNSLFYSRRIGRQPTRGGLPGAEFASAPAQTSILGAAKLTGRTDSGLSLGALVATTAREEAEAFFVGKDSLAVFLAEPRAEYGVVRLSQDLRGGGTVVGGIATAMRRDLPDDGSFDFLPGEAYNAGLNFEHTWKSREWAVWGFLAGSHVRGTEEALIRLQRSSSHYFQRPDAYGLGVDSSATSMTGAEWRLQAERRSGRHWTGSIWAAQRTPGFEVNDLGYFRGTERLDAGARVSYQEITPGEVFRSYRFGLTTFHNWRHEALRDPWSSASWARAHKAGSVMASANASFLNYWGVDVNARYSPELLDDAATRGGPLMLRPATLGFGIRGSTDARRPLTLQPSAGAERTATAGIWSWNAAVEAAYRPLPSVEVEVQPSYRAEREAAQYVGRFRDPSYTPTFGERYVFGDLDRRTFSLDTRLNLTMSPALTLQLFLQPLLSVGDYTSYKQLRRAESFEFDRFSEGEAARSAGRVVCVRGESCRQGDVRYLDLDRDGAVDASFEERDFRVRSLRGNAVLRWEYRPGSTAFLVWQQQRSYRDLEGQRFDLGTEFGDLLLDRPENQIILKINYWLSL